MASIERRKKADGSFSYRIKVSVGGRQIGRSFSTLAEAKLWANGTELAHARGTSTTPTKEKFAPYARRFVDDVLSQRVRTRTLEGYSDVLRRFVEEPPSDYPTIGNDRVDRITSARLQALYAHMVKAGYAAGSVRHLHSVLRQVLRHADRASVLTKIQLPKKDRRTVTVLSEAELGRFLRAAREDHYAPVWVLLGTCAARPGEVLGLRWADVDFEGGTIRIERTLSRTRGDGWKLTEPKTRSGRRTIPVPESTLAVLRAWKKEQSRARLAAGKGWADHDFVTTADSGEPLDWTNLRKSYHRICAEAGGLGEWEEIPPKPQGQPGPPKTPAFVPTFRPYDLRHSVATHLLRKGVNPKVVSEMLGHASVGFTLDVYAGNLLPSSGDQVAAIMNALAIGE